MFRFSVRLKRITPRFTVTWACWTGVYKTGLVVASAVVGAALGVKFKAESRAFPIMETVTF